MRLERTPRGAERVADRDVCVLVGAVALLAVADHDVGPGDRQRDPDVDVLALVLALMRPFDHHLAAPDPLVHAAELGGPAAHELLQRGRRLHVSKPDLDGERHDPTRCMDRADTGAHPAAGARRSAAGWFAHGLHGPPRWVHTVRTVASPPGPPAGGSRVHRLAGARALSAPRSCWRSSRTRAG